MENAAADQPRATPPAPPAEPARETKPRSPEGTANPTQEEGEKKPKPIPRGSPRTAVADTVAERHRQRMESEQPPPPADPDAKVRVKVYGEEREVPKTDVDAAGGIEAYQMIEARKRQLDEARQASLETERLRREQQALTEEMKERRRALEEAENTGAPRAPKPSSQRPAPEASANRDEELTAVGEDGLTEAQRKRIAAMEDEYADEVVDMARSNARLENKLQALERQSAPIVAEQERMRQQRLQEYQQSIDSANRWFSEHYSEFERDPRWREAASAMVNKITRDEPQIAPQALVERVGAELEAMTSSVGDARELSARLERKRNMHAAPKGASMARPPTPEERPPSRSEIIAAHRRARGQPNP